MFDKSSVSERLMVYIIGGEYIMKKQEIKQSVKRRRARQAAKRKILVLLATMLVITIGSIIFGHTFSAAKAESDQHETLYKYYKSIELEYGDSLWSIAEEYKLEGTSTQDYIDEIKEINNLTSDTIHKDQYLVIVYYDTEFK